jgi:hypothetical protein
MTIAPDPTPEKTASLLEAFCARCSRKTYVRRGAALACPVCASPLIVDPSDNQR